MEVILVHWRIRADAEEAFKGDFPPLPADTAGLIREDLYKGASPELDVATFVRVGRWESQADFNRALVAMGLQPGVPPTPRAYEIGPRCREWLSFIREDYPCPDGPSRPEQSPTP